ncbi:MAG: methyltransferase domain-containing protein [Microthrixaceae bacterium]
MTAVLRANDGGTIALDLDRWRAEPDDHERVLLGRVADPVLDIGCGPGRIVRALASTGRLALGIDPAPALAHDGARRGAPILQRSVFAHLPGEGRWGTALLLDGNVGIGGDPVTLLRRCRDLLRPGGTVVAEIAPPGTATAPMTVRVETRDAAGPWFRWAVVGVDDWPRLAREAGFGDAEVHAAGCRWFGEAARP